MLHHRESKSQRLDLLVRQAKVYADFLAEKLKTTNNYGDIPSKKKKDHSINFKQPKSFTGGELRPYQLDGIKWLSSLYENGLNGILADEMGLGKTIQCIGFLAFLRDQDSWGPFLIVAPLSTLNNWENEVHKFAPLLPCVVYHGSAQERENIRNIHWKKNKENFPISITSYEIILKDKKYIQKIQWKFIIIDEGHRIKNLNCKLVNVLKSFHSTNRFLLTGTPLQNNLSELWSLLNYLLPEVFDDLKSFENWFNLNDESDLINQQNPTLLTDQEIKSLIENLHIILKPFLLRRLKIDVEKSLPSKVEYLVYCNLTRDQLELYQAILQGTLRETLDKKSLQNNHDDLEFSYSPSNSLQNMFVQLRKVCNHPLLFPKYKNTSMITGNDRNKQQKLMETSGKMIILDQLLTKLVALDHRILIFSQMSKMLDIIEDYLIEKKMKYCRIDGSIGNDDRIEQINEFNQKNHIPIFLLTTRAGGLGINLSTADTVIFYDSDWVIQI